MSWLIARKELCVSEGLVCSQALPYTPATAYPPVSPPTCLSACPPAYPPACPPSCLSAHHLCALMLPTCLPTCSLPLAPAQWAAGEIPLHGRSTFNLHNPLGCLGELDTPNTRLSLSRWMNLVSLANDQLMTPLTSPFHLFCHMWERTPVVRTPLTGWAGWNWLVKDTNTGWWGSWLGETPSA